MSTPINRLVCPHCQCPLTAASGQATGMHCPRCNTWLDIDPACIGSCVSCHKLHQIESTKCVDEAQACSSKNESETGDSSLFATWKKFVKRTFNGR